MTRDLSEIWTSSSLSSPTLNAFALAEEERGIRRSRIRHRPMGAALHVDLRRVMHNLCHGERWIERYYTLDTPNWDRIGNGTYPGTFIEELNWRNTAIELGLLDPDIEPMRSHEFTLGMERQIGPRSSIGVRYVRKRLDRTIEDVGVLGPSGEEYFIANPGFRVASNTMKAVCPTCPPVPRAQRDYDSVEFRYLKRFASRWSLDASYMWSRLYGNYNGLANSDELRVAAGNDIAGAGNDPRPPGGGRTSPNVNRAFDLIYDSFTEQGKVNLGPLPIDGPTSSGSGRPTSSRSTRAPACSSSARAAVP